MSRIVLFARCSTVRAFASLELSASGERGLAMEGLARHCGKQAVLSAAGLVGPAQSEWLNRIRDELENYRAAMRWLLDQGRHDAASDIAWGLGMFFLFRGATTEGLHWYREILGAPSLSPLSESEARVGAGLMYWARGEFEPARTELERA